jgi:hypothetical protein
MKTNSVKVPIAFFICGVTLDVLQETSRGGFARVNAESHMYAGHFKMTTLTPYFSSNLMSDNLLQVVGGRLRGLVRISRVIKAEQVRPLSSVDPSSCSFMQLRPCGGL